MPRSRPNARYTKGGTLSFAWLGAPGFKRMRTARAPRWICCCDCCCLINQRGLPVRRAGHEKRSETPRCPAKIHNACVGEASRKAACARRRGQRTATAGGLPVRRDGWENESETPRCQAKGLARPQGRGRTRALTAGAMGSGVGQRNGVASADASVATADRVAFPRVCCPRRRPSSPADSPSSSRYPSPALR